MNSSSAHEPVTLMRMTAHEHREGSVQVSAELSPPPPPGERWWWLQQVRHITGFVGATGGNQGFALVVQVPRGELEAAARQLRNAVAEAGATYRERYTVDKRAVDEGRVAAQEARRQQQETDQAVLDRVMSEY